MSRPLRIDLADGWYHVLSRGLEHRDLLADDRDRGHFLDVARGMCEAAPPSGARRPTDPARRAAAAAEQPGAAACRQLAAADRWLEGDVVLRSAVAKAARQLMTAQAKESIHGLLAGCLLVCGCLVGYSAEPSMATRVREASLVKGDAYRSVVAAIDDMHEPATEIRALLDTEGLSTEERIIGRILLARLTSEEVFENYQSIIESFRKQQQSTRPLATTPGRLSGILYNFATAGPESKTVRVRQGTRRVGIITRGYYVQVEKFTDDEIRAGKSRNLAARMAIHEHLLKFAEEGSEYEQCELVHAVTRLWEVNNQETHPEGIPIVSFLDAVAQDQTRSPAVRVIAMTYLPPDIRSGDRELMRTVIESPETSDEERYHHVVRRAIAYLQDRDTDSIHDISTDTHWKRILLNEALGQPAPPRPPKAKEDEVGTDIHY